MSSTRVYESAVDPWFYPVLFFAPWAATSVSLYFASHTLNGLWIGIITGAATFSVVWPFTRPCRYTLSDEALQIKSGFIETVIPLRKIQKAERTWSLVSAPCLSVHRVLITTTDEKEMVSPSDRDAFITDLLSRVQTQMPNQSLQPTGASARG